MFKPRETMIVLFFLGMLHLSHTDPILAEKTKGDYPDANKVMMKLPQTYMLQSLGNFTNIICGYQEFYTLTKGKETFRMYDFFLRYTDGHSFHQPYYVKDVQNYIIDLGTLPDPSYPPTAAREILFSDMRSCMVIKNPKNPKVCNLMVTKDRFFNTSRKMPQKIPKALRITGVQLYHQRLPLPRKKENKNPMKI
uniref:Putative secreted protein n=1 Tax=Ixodes ricinus TaxID=34613 RepID=A0A090XET3_IXORI